MATKTKKQTEKKPTKPAKGKYVPPSAEDWKTKPALLKLVAEHGKAAPAVHKIQHELKTVRATVKKYAEAMAQAIARLHTPMSGRGEHYAITQSDAAADLLRAALAS